MSHIALAIPLCCVCARSICAIMSVSVHMERIELSSDNISGG